MTKCGAMLGAIVALTLVPGFCRAESPDQLKKDCHDSVVPFRWWPPIHDETKLEECLIDTFTLQWPPFDPKYGYLSPAFGNIGAGSLFAGGLKYASYFDNENQSLTLGGLYSVKKFNQFSGIYTARLKPRATDPNSFNQKSELQGQLNLRASRTDMVVQDFYGLGPKSSLAGHAVYRQLQYSAGADVVYPVTGWLSLGADAHYLHPVIKGVSGNSAPSVITAYDETGAPGSTTQADFGEVGAKLGLFGTHHPFYFGDRCGGPCFTVMEYSKEEVRYEHFSEVGSNQYSFGRLSATTSHEFDLRPYLPFDPTRSRWKDVLCMQEVGEYCDIGKFTVSGLVTASYTGVGSSVPFYLQPTLGGSDIDGVDTLRGLVDYRLRAPNRVHVSVDFDKPLSVIPCSKTKHCGGFGLYAFFDAGNVEMRPGDLSFSDLRTDVGVGMSYLIMNKIVFRAYYGFGAGEGSHPNFKLASGTF